MFYNYCMDGIVSPFLLSHIYVTFMSEVNKRVEHLLGSKCPIKTLSDLIRETQVSEETRTELEDVVSMLEIHENELRNLRQSLNLRLRQFNLSYYKEYLIRRI